MTVLILGLGLIGASLAKTLKKNTAHRVLGWNRTPSVAQRALADGAIDATGTLEELLPQADITIINFYPEAIVPFILEHKDLFKKDSVVTDSCGIKTKICRQMAAHKDLPFTFIGAHPMAEDMGFARTVVTTPEHHDEMIAFTSQIAHVLACSYVLSPLAPQHAGFSAGSYRDVSRVARINAEMWAQLFIDNKEPLIREIDDLVGNLQKFRSAIEAEDAPELRALMEQGNRIKEEIG